MAGLLWWIGLAVVVVAVLPAVLWLAARIIRSLAVIEGAARDIRSSLQAVAGGVPPAMAGLGEVASRCERLAARDPVAV